MRATSPFILLVSILAFAGTVDAQTWRCETPKGCELFVEKGAKLQPITFVLVDSLNNVGVKVNVLSSGGDVRILNPKADTTAGSSAYLTDRHGAITGYVVGPINDEVRIVVQSMRRDGELYTDTTITLTPAKSAQVQLEPLQRKYIWYTGSQIQRGVVGVHAVGVADSIACNGIIVKYKPLLGTTTPDSVRGLLRTDTVKKKPLEIVRRCQFETHWRLADQVGEQHMYAVAPNAAQVTLVGKARRRATVRAAAAPVIYIGGADTFNPRELRKMQVEHTTGDGRVLKYDSTSYSAKTINTEKWDVKVYPLLLFDTPLLAHWEGFRLAAGVSITDPTRDFFVGASLFQAFTGLNLEDVGVDLQAGFIFSRLERLENRNFCEQNLEATEAVRAAACETTKSPRLSGVGGTVSLDLGPLLATIGKYIGLK